MTIRQWAKDLVLRLARVPSEPRAPEGAEESIRVFHAGRNYLTLRLIMRGIANGAMMLGLLVMFGAGLTPGVPPFLRTVWLVLGVGAVCVFAAAWWEFGRSR